MTKTGPTASASGRLASWLAHAGLALIVMAAMSGPASIAHAQKRGAVDFGQGDHRAKKQIEEGGGGIVGHSGPGNPGSQTGAGGSDTPDSDSDNDPPGGPGAGNNPNQHGTNAHGGNGTGSPYPCTPKHPEACKGAHPQ